MLTRMIRGGISNTMNGGNGGGSTTLSPKDWEVLSSYLTKLPVYVVESAQKSIRDKWDGVAPPRRDGLHRRLSHSAMAHPADLEVSSYVFQLEAPGSNGCLIGGTEASANVSINARAHKCKYNVMLPPYDTRYDVKVEPMSGKLKPGGKSHQIKFTLVVQTMGLRNIQCVVGIDVEGGYRHFLVLDLRPTPASSASSTPLTQDAIFVSHPHTVPSPLAALRTLFATLNGYSTAGVFRDNPTEKDMNRVWDAIQNGTTGALVRDGTVDAVCVAGCIKSYIKIHTPHILTSLPTSILLSPPPNPSATLGSHLPPSDLSILTWILDLCVACSREGKMSLKLFATVFAPSLTPPPSSTSGSGTGDLEDLMAGLKVTQGVVGFLSACMEERVAVVAGAIVAA
ncbi:hypothetical protein HK104_002792 [Borealophlyctis nickersoniae]|nr:hypothetical protein HK104_002792 [Borealophlyctis nickersoniae]